MMISMFFFFPLDMVFTAFPDKVANCAVRICEYNDGITNLASVRQCALAAKPSAFSNPTDKYEYAMGVQVKLLTIC